MMEDGKCQTIFPTILNPPSLHPQLYLTPVAYSFTFERLPVFFPP